VCKLFDQGVNAEFGLHRLDDWKAWT